MEFAGLAVFAVDCVEAAGGIPADLDFRELLFQSFRGDAVEFEILLARAAPHRRIFRLVPDFPVGDPELEPVGPAVIVMPHDPRADFRPFFEILRRMVVVALDPVVVFDGHPQAVEDLRSGGADLFQIGVGECEIVGFGLFRVRLEIGKHVRDVHVMRPAVSARGVVQTAERDPRLFEPLGRLVETDRTVIDSVQRFDFFFRFPAEIDGDCCCFHPAFILVMVAVSL